MIKKKEFTFSLIILLIISIISFFPDSIITGFDNASPYFSANITLYRIFHSSNLFNYGGLIFSPDFLLSFLGISPPWLSFLYFAGALLTGAYFINQIIQKFEPKYSPLFLLITIFGSLLSHFIFSIPLHIFVPAFAGIPAFIYLLSTQRVLKKNIPFSILGLLYFAATIINPIAFLLNLIQAVIVSAALPQRKQIRSILIKGGSMLASILLLFQILLVFCKPTPTFIFTELLDYGAQIKVDHKSSLTSSSITDMETKRNSFVNVSRFAGGWSTLTDINDEPLYLLSEYIDKWPIVLISLTPTFFWLYFFFTNKQKREDQKKLVKIWFVGLFLSSSYFLLFIQSIPYVSTVLRWSSSKFWPLIFFPSILLLNTAFVHSSKKLLKVCTILSLLLFSSPWVIGIINKHQKVSMPTEYRMTFSKFNTKDKILYLPTPQRLYMRQYKWGYYGSSFLPYITKATIYDDGVFSPEQNKYERISYLFSTCQTEQLKNEVSYVVIDKSLVNTKQSVSVGYILQFSSNLVLTRL